MKKAIIYFLKGLASLILVLLAVVLGLQVVAPVYDFPTTVPFSGAYIYNPYKGFDSSQVLKSNFHAHTQWDTDSAYTEEQFVEAYKAQGYDVISMANHQALSRLGHVQSYEHGINASNYHISVLGTECVSWLDFPLMFRPLHQMQFMINHLTPQATILAVNHADRIRFADYERVFGKLRGYPLMEMNPPHDPKCWDIALSSGIYSNLVANDDAHSITRRHSWMQKCFSMVCTSSDEPDSLLSALRRGNAYGTVISNEKNMSKHPHANLPKINNIALNGEVVSIRMDSKADSIRFIGQGGRTVYSVSDTTGASYVFAPQDTYIRVVAHYPLDIQVWSNPFVRISGEQNDPHSYDKPTVLWTMTLLNILIWIAVSGGLIWLTVLLWKKR